MTERLTYKGFPLPEGFVPEPAPPGLDKYSRRLHRWKQLKKAAFDVFYATTPERANCINHDMTPKLVYGSFEAAFVEIHRMRLRDVERDVRAAHFVVPYRCRLGHVHIGGLPNANRILPPSRG